MFILEDKQLSFDTIPFLKYPYDPEHPLMKLEAAIRWDNLLEALAGFYCPDEGRPTTPLRAQAGTLILKYVKHLPDRDAVIYVRENLYAQRFCGLSPEQAVDYMHPASGLSNFRAQIGPEGMVFIEEVLHAAARKKPLKRGNKVIIDTTCVPLDIRYPTDIRLLERCRREVLSLIRKAKAFGIEASYRTYARVARKIYTVFAKLSKPKAQTRKKVHKQMQQFVRRNLNQLKDLRMQCTQVLGRRVGDESDRRRWEVLRFLQRLKESERKIQIILHQQRQIYRGNVHLRHRIVSFHKDHVRPIMRGKFPVPTEFGPKVLLAVVRGYTYVVQAFQDNVSDTRLVVPALRWFKTVFGKFPRELLADRGMWKRAMARWLRGAGVGCGIQVKGNSVLDTPATRRQIRQRLPIEARISLSKRCFGWDRCRARNDDHEESWIRLGAAAMNVHLAYGDTS
jgi:hypothetical protein